MMKKLIKKFVYRLNSNPLSKFLYDREIQRRSQLDLTNILPLSKHIQMFSPFTNEIHQPNDWYGNAKIFKKFLSLPQDYQFKFIIEHGTYFNEQVDQVDIETDLPSIVTYCDYRVGVLKKYRQNVFSVGPFIHYADHFLSDEEIRREKNRLGRSLLLFPAHSSLVIKFEYDIVKLCRKIKKLGKDFDSIRVCLYWTDVLAGRDKIYRDFGFECVSAGHILDPLFLPRLKSLIETSTATASNLASTHVGYSIFMNKPHVILSDKPSYKASKYWHRRITDFFKSDTYQNILMEFSTPKYKITQKQKRLVEKYWGTNSLKTKKELKKIIDKTEVIYQKTQ